MVAEYLNLNLALQMESNFVLLKVFIFFCQIVSYERSINKILNVSIDGILWKWNYTWKYWWFTWLNIISKRRWNFNGIFSYIHCDEVNMSKVELVIRVLKLVNLKYLYMESFMGHSMEYLEDIYVHENIDYLFYGISLVNEDCV